MATLYDDEVLQFQYPENWQVERQDTEEGWTVSVQSPGTAFLLISFYTERPEVQDILQTALQAMQQDYPELEAEPVSEKWNHHATKGYDITFFSLDTVNQCQLRALRTAKASILILSQHSTFDSATHIAVLDAIRVSMQMKK
ncbi:MAG: hypothetical protein JNJ77_17385 [Planctomycetia bacterium]|nr:hypothetical protein [Planctomycetia bacterium]